MDYQSEIAILKLSALTVSDDIFDPSNSSFIVKIKTLFSDLQRQEAPLRPSWDEDLLCLAQTAKTLDYRSAPNLEKVFRSCSDYLLQIENLLEQDVNGELKFRFAFGRLADAISQSCIDIINSLSSSQQASFTNYKLLFREFADTIAALLQTVQFEAKESPHPERIASTHMAARLGLFPQTKTLSHFESSCENLALRSPVRLIEREPPSLEGLLNSFKSSMKQKLLSIPQHERHYCIAFLESLLLELLGDRDQLPNSKELTTRFCDDFIDLVRSKRTKKEALTYDMFLDLLAPHKQQNDAWLFQTLDYSLFWSPEFGIIFPVVKEYLEKHSGLINKVRSIYPEAARSAYRDEEIFTFTYIPSSYCPAIEAAIRETFKDLAMMLIDYEIECIIERIRNDPTLNNETE